MSHDFIFPLHTFNVLKHMSALSPSCVRECQRLSRIFTKYSPTSLASTQIIYGFKTREALDLLRIEDPDVDSSADDVSANTATVMAYPITRSADGNDAAALVPLTDYRSSHIDAKDAIAFASLRIKEYYDSHHQPKFFKVGDLVNLRLHRGYRVPAIKFKKLGPQLIGPFPVIERIERRLAYRLRLSSMMRIHDVISVAHLEPATDSAEDLYRRQRLSMLAVVVDEEDKSEIEKLLQKRRIRRGRDWSTQYRVRWLIYDLEDNT